MLIQAELLKKSLSAENNENFVSVENNGNRAALLKKQ